MFKAYLDDSGTHDGSPVLVIGGYVSSGHAWERFKPTWGKFLKAHGVTELHMKHFVQGFGEFEGWTEKEKAPFAKEATRLIRSHVRYGSVMALPTKEFQEILAERSVTDLKLKRDGLRLCLHMCLADMVEYVRLQPGERIAVVFDRTDEFRYQLHKHFDFLLDDNPEWQRVFHSITFASRLDETPLQAADALAYESYRYTSEHHYVPSVREPRKFFKELLRHPRVRVAAPTKSELGQFVGVIKADLDRLTSGEHEEERKNIEAQMKRAEKRTQRIFMAEGEKRRDEGKRGKP